MTRMTILLVMVFLVVVTCLTFGDVVQCRFVLWDDDFNLFHNRYLQPVSISSYHRFWTSPLFLLYVPVTYSVWAVIAHFWHLAVPVRAVNGGDTTLYAEPFHAASLVLHVLNVLLVFFILWKTTCRRGTVGSLFCAGAGALLFAVHPIQTEAVAWASELRGLLSAFFGLLALILFLRHAVERLALRRIGLLVAATLAFSLGLLSKPTLVVLPLLTAAMIQWLPNWDGRQESFRRHLWPLSIWTLFAVIFALVTTRFQAEPPSVHVLLWQRPLVAADAITFYLRKSILPIDLCPDYGRTPAVALADKSLWLSAAIPFLITVLAWRLRKRCSPVFAGWIIFLVALLPVLGLRPFIFQAISTVADRYVYLSMLGAAIALASVLDRIRLVAVHGVAWCILLLLSFLANLQLQYWDDTLSLSARAIAINPRSNVFYDVRGVAEAHDGNITDALNNCAKAVSICPQDPDAHTNFGMVLSMSKNFELSAIQYRDATRLDPHNAVAWNNLAIDLEQIGRNRDSEAAFHTSIRASPGYANAYVNLGILLASEGRYSEAIKVYSDALAIDPTQSPVYVHLGQVYLQMGDARQASELATAALRYDSGSAAASQLLADAESRNSAK